MGEIKTLMIIAAGNGSRMGFLPKAISLVNGTPNLYNTVNLAYKHFDKIYVFTLEKYIDLYKEVVEQFSDKCEVIDIISGYGCGDAVRTSLLSIYKKISDDLVMVWGDVYISDEKIFEEILLNKTSSPLLIPVVKEEDPYVWFSKDFHDRINAAMFRKRDEIISSGYHDQSIFKLKKKEILEALNMMWMVNKKHTGYLHGELIFLDIVHVLYHTEKYAETYETKYPTMAYNTHGELLDINRKISEKKITK